MNFNRRPWIAFLFSLFTPPMGQVYNLQYRKAILLLSVELIFPILMLVLKIPNTFMGLIFVFVISFFFYIYMIIDSIINSKKRHEIVINRKKCNSINLVGFAFIVVFEIILMPFLILNVFTTLKTYTTPVNSMKPTLVRGDRFIADMFLFTNYVPKKGDLVLYYSKQGDSLVHVHRCIATENDTVMISNDNLYLNGNRQIEPFAIGKTKIFRNQFTETNRIYKIPAGAIFILGDNRPDAIDSRYLGLIPLSRVLGKALYIYYSEDFSRIGKSLVVQKQ